MKRSSTTVIFITPWANITLERERNIDIIAEFFPAKSPLGTVGDDLGTVDFCPNNLFIC